ncbi:hypothetical protein [Sphingomonas natans]|uniref:hypothetical protein n=1 Tax=Sphingomonas natans TaxID=3063330 RepID=UPI0026E39DA2|nr:hypothetical protein [Sphingomonas sp. BIUV-7]
MPALTMSPSPDVVADQAGAIASHASDANISRRREEGHPIIARQLAARMMVSVPL